MIFFYILPEERRLRLRFGPVSDGTASDAPAFPIFPLSLHFLTLSIFTQSYILKVEVQEVQTQIYYFPNIATGRYLDVIFGTNKTWGDHTRCCSTGASKLFCNYKKKTASSLCVVLSLPQCQCLPLPIVYPPILGKLLTTFSPPTSPSSSKQSIFIFFLIFFLSNN